MKPPSFQTILAAILLALIGLLAFGFTLYPVFTWGAVVGAIVLVLVVSLLFFVLDLWTDGGSR